MPIKDTASCDHLLEWKNDDKCLVTGKLTQHNQEKHDGGWTQTRISAPLALHHRLGNIEASTLIHLHRPATLLQIFST